MTKFLLLRPHKLDEGNLQASAKSLLDKMIAIFALIDNDYLKADIVVVGQLEKWSQEHTIAPQYRVNTCTLIQSSLFFCKKATMLVSRNFETNVHS